MAAVVGAGVHLGWAPAPELAILEAGDAPDVSQEEKEKPRDYPEDGSAGSEARAGRVWQLEHLEGLLMKPDSAARDTAIAALIDGLQPGEIKAAVEILAALPDDGREHELPFTKMMQRWAHEDGPAAFSFAVEAARQPGVRAEFYFAAGAALEAWAEHSVEEAAAAVAGLPPGLSAMDSQRFAHYIAQAFAKRDAAAGHRWAERLLQTPGHSALAQEAALALARAASNQGPAMRESTLAWLLENQHHERWAEAILWQAWRDAGADPVGAWAWIERLSGAELRRGAAEALIEQWRLIAPAEAEAWVESMRGHPDFEMLAQGWSRTRLRETPEAGRDRAGAAAHGSGWTEAGASPLHEVFQPPNHD
jgi:hypothetical protein